ncbi:MAG: CRTAC1 family protein, partial [Myxococcales bacterium]|nr:CRTAC1 family protein [Myxococcales bacterium]
FLDYDNDGWLDLYVGLGKWDPGPQMPNALLHNRHDGGFDILADLAGAGDPRFSLSVAIADFDVDGWLDISIANSGERYALFHSDGGAGPRNHFLEVRLRAEVPGVNREGIGARVVVLDDQGGSQVRELIAGTSLGAGSSTIAHFGLGTAVPEALHVIWPDGHVQQLADPPVDVVLDLACGP